MNDAAGPAAKCPSCGREAGRPVSSRVPAGAVVTGALPVKKKRRYQTDAAIALAVVVILISMWHLLTKPQILGPVGGQLQTNLFGSFGIRLAQSAGLGVAGDDAPPQAADNPAGPTNQTANLRPTGVSSNQNSGTGDSAPVDTPSTNQNFKTIVDVSDDASDPATNSPDATALAQRLGAVGAKTGDIEFSLSWNNANDLDLHCIDPRGVEIWFENTNSVATGGLLDHDANAHEFINTPVENIFWPVNGAPAGTYRVYVVHYQTHGGQDPTRFTVRALVKNQTNYFTGYISYTGNPAKMPVCTLLYDPANSNPAKRQRFINSSSTR